jgi:PAS domain S-box-containing protein
MPEFHLEIPNQEHPHKKLCTYSPFFLAAMTWEPHLFILMSDTVVKNSGTKLVARICGLLAVGIGAVGLAGWVFDLPTFQRVHPALVTMKANTAIALLLTGISLRLLLDEKAAGMRRWLAKIFAAMVTLLGLLTLAEHGFGWDFGIDQFWFHESLASAGPSFPGRMGVASTIVFTCLGSALMFLDSKVAGRYWATKFAVVAAVATTLVFLYYFYGIDHGDAISKYVTIALHTVVAFYALCVGIFFARPDRGIMLDLLGPSMGSVVARRMLPAAFFLPILLGWLRTLGRDARLFSPGFGTAAFVLLIILLFTALIHWTVTAINRQEAARRRIEAALRRSESDLRDFVDNAMVGLHWVGPDGIITWANKAELNLLGYSSEEYIGHPVSDFHADAPVIADIISRLTKGESLHEYPARLRCKDGSIRQVLISSNVRFEDGRFIHTRCFTHDITERSTAEQALRESEQRFRALVTATSDIVYRMSPDWTEMHSLDGRDLVKDADKPSLIWLQKYIRPVDQPQVLAAIHESIRTKSIFELEHQVLRKDGSFGWAFSRAIPLLGADREIVEWFGTTSDETARKQAEEAVRESESRKSAILDSSLDAIITMDHKGRIVDFNPAAERTFGYRREDVVGQPVAEKIVPERLRAAHYKGLTHYLASGEGPVLNQRIEVPALHADGHEFFIELSINRIVGVEPPVFTSTMRDITGRKKAEEALLLAKERAEAASRAKDDFLAALSHELRTPLTPVLMMASALGDDPALPTDVREHLAMMRRNVELEARLIDDLLDLTRINRGKLAIAPVIADVHQLLAYTAEIVLSDRLGKDVSIAFKHGAGRHHALADPARLQQVFWNLIKNAIKFTPAGGTITVSTHNDAQDRIILSVEDTGIGISVEAQSSIFEAFEQGDAAGQHRYGGLGLGLAISKAIMEAHGGTIAATSEGQGHGAVFTITLASVAPPASPDEGSTGQPGPTQGLRLLIVEDHETTRAVLAQLLTRRGHQVTTASSSQEALSTYAAGAFDAVISDLGLPDGSGLELMREIQRLRPVPAIALSGYGMEDDLRLSKEAGFFAHLVKPVNLGQLRQLIDQITPAAAQASTRGERQCSNAKAGEMARIANAPQSPIPPHSL